ncbi:hypothetical protein E2C01_005540 [Portunus trituberculatus]|uniref:Uncharacterized protein n=1 Tax=Portunus trituberculatus TaxID=210409 RepID=A0A5B7CUL5_PORTR|nr:hypothetical protein [Portunus trituberculatus]
MALDHHDCLPSCVGSGCTANYTTPGMMCFGICLVLYIPKYRTFTLQLMNAIWETMTKPTPQHHHHTYCTLMGESPERALSRHPPPTTITTHPSAPPTQQQQLSSTRSLKHSLTTHGPLTTLFRRTHQIERIGDGEEVLGSALISALIPPRLINIDSTHLVSAKSCRMKENNNLGQMKRSKYSAQGALAQETSKEQK